MSNDTGEHTTQYIGITLRTENGNMRSFDLVPHLHRQRAFSLATFGPGERTAGVLAHIRKELAEIEEQPDDITEWADLLILAFDGAMRRGFTPERIANALVSKQAVNEMRAWPDWRTAPHDQPIEHVKEVGV